MAVFRKGQGARPAGAADGPSRIEEAQVCLERAYGALIDGLDPVAARVHFTAATDLLEHCVRWNVEDVVAWGELARVRAELGQREAAQAAVRRLVQLAGDNPESLLRAAEEALLDLKEEALGAEILERIPTVLRGERWRALGEVLERRRERRRAFPLSDAEVLALREHLFGLGVVRLEGAGATPACDHTLRHTEAWLAAQGRPVAPLRALMTAGGWRACDCAVLLRLEPLDPCDTLGHWRAFAAQRAWWRREARVEGLFEQGRALEERGEHDVALGAFDAALVLAPDRAPVHLYRGKVLHALRRWEEALASYERAAALAPKEAQPQFAVAEALLDLERPVEAEAAARRAVALAGGRPPAEAFQTLASAVIDQDRWADAVRDLEAGLAVHAEHPELAYLHGYCLFRLGREAEARAAYDLACARAPDEKYPWYLKE